MAVAADEINTNNIITAETNTRHNRTKYRNIINMIIDKFLFHLKT
jgi:hypothetical protein